MATAYEKQLKALTLKVWLYKQGEMVSLMIHIGDRLGLYKSLSGAGVISAEQLAEKTKYHPRWILEWLKNQAAAGIIEYHEGDRFELTDVGSAVMANEVDSLQFAVGAFNEPLGAERIEKVIEAFKTGLGFSYQDQGPACAHSTERMLAPWTKLALIPQIIPQIEGVKEKLEKNAVVADVGCGTGTAIMTLAEAYPNSDFHGYDSCGHAIERANERVKELGLTNIVFHHVAGEGLPEEETFDFVLTFDCMHDMTRPDLVISAIRQSLKADGTWLIKDIKSTGDFVGDQKNPTLALLYAFSITSCMSSALSEPDGLGLGTLGFHPKVAEEMTKAGGFSQFKLHDVGDPSNLYYEIKI